MRLSDYFRMSTHWKFFYDHNGAKWQVFDGANFWSGTGWQRIFTNRVMSDNVNGVFDWANPVDNWRVDIDTNTFTSLGYLVMKGKLKLFIGGFLFLFVLTPGMTIANTTTTTSGFTWTPILFESVHDLVISGRQDIYAGGGAWDTGLFKLKAGEEIWQAIIIGNIPHGPYVTALAASGQDIYVASVTDVSGGVGKFKGDEERWENAGTGFPATTGTFRPVVQAFAVSGQDIYAGIKNIAGTGGGGVFKLAGGQGSWQDVSTGLPSNPSVRALAVSGQDIYAGVESKGIFRLRGGQGSWQDVSTGLPSNPVVLALAASSQDIYAGIKDKGVFKLTGGQGNWQDISMGLPSNSSVPALAASGQDIYVGIEGKGVFKLMAGQGRWQDISMGFPSISYVQALVVSGQDIYVGGSGVFRGSKVGPKVPTLPFSISIDVIGPGGNLKDELTATVKRFFPGASLSQNPKGGTVEIAISPQITISAFPMGVFGGSSLPPEGKPQISIDQDWGRVIFHTSSGVQGILAPVPYSMAKFNNELEKAGLNLSQVRVGFSSGQMEMRIADSRLFFKPDFVVKHTDQSPGMSINAQDNVVITYEGGKQQVFFPYIVDWLELREMVRSISGVEKIQVSLDGTIELAFHGTSFKFKPDYIVTTAPPETPAGFESVDGNSVKITFKDGTQQVVRLIR